MHKLTKTERLSQLGKLIDSGKFQAQEELLLALRKKGIDVTQATLSRDLLQLGAVKREGKYTLGPIGYALDGQSKVVSMKFVEPNMIVMKTSPGLAQAVARLVDESVISGIAGTVAGDDTVLIVIDSQKSHGTILNTLSKIFSRSRRRS